MLLRLPLQVLNGPPLELDPSPLQKARRLEQALKGALGATEPGQERGGYDMVADGQIVDHGCTSGR
jgi:hypothetical protein